ncbi:MAG: hypothetical protein WAX79_06410 [Candidatus Omnitrophota bacterium]
MGSIDKIRKLPIISLLISSLILCFVVYFVLLPAIKQCAALAKSIKDKKADLASLQSFNSRYAVLKEEIRKKSSELEALKSKLFWGRDISKFLNELTRLATDLKIEFVSLKPEISPPSLAKDDKKSKKEPDDYLQTQVSIAVSFRSNYNDIVIFLKRIEEGDKFIKINSLNIEKQPDNIYNHNVNMKLDILVEKGG